MTAPKASRPPEKYDFAKPRRLTRDRMRTIGAIHERVMRGFEAWLFSRVRGQIEIDFPQVDVVSFGEFTAQLPTPCAAYTFEVLETGGQQGVVEVGADFSTLLVDRFFGGAGEPQKIERALSPIERLAVRLVVERLLSLLADAWRDYVPFETALRSFESLPIMVRGLNKEEPVLVSILAIVVDGFASEVRIAIPLNVLGDFFTTRETRRVSEMAGTDEERVHARVITETAIRSTNVEVSARLPEFTAPIRSLLELTAGAVLPTGIPINTPLDVTVAGANRFHAVPGRIGPRLAIRLVDAPPSPLVHADH
ncbi:MAG: FliM/FliN family flagellar motor switch protein [Gemmatimonadetes bacterium]|nr:FliM/FliN family flagellar motor switch protein [Gemmatimonadota bacterium]